VSATLGFLADVDFDNDILRGLWRHLPDLDVVRAQDIGLDSAPDPLVLQWADEHEQIILTHDARTMPRHAYERIRSGTRVAGVCAVPQLFPIGLAIQDLLVVAQCSTLGDWENQVRYLPL